MAIFLENLENKILWDLGAKFQTLRSNTEKGVPYRRQKWTYPQRYVRLGLKYLLGTDVDTAWDFFLARKGSFEKFTWFLPVSDTYTKENVGQGDGSSTTFDIMGKDISSYTVYVDGATQTEGGGADYTIGDGTGTDGRDQIIFNSAPSNGGRIEITYTGTLGLYYTFEKDDFSKPGYITALKDWNLVIVEEKQS